MLTTSLFSSNWVGCVAVRDVKDAPTDPITAPDDKYTGYINFGVIWGYKQFNYGYGVRQVKHFVGKVCQILRSLTIFSSKAVKIFQLFVEL